jgi:hypothetical protein
LTGAAEKRAENFDRENTKRKKNRQSGLVIPTEGDSEMLFSKRRLKEEPNIEPYGAELTYFFF